MSARWCSATRTGRLLLALVIAAAGIALPGPGTLRDGRGQPVGERIAETSAMAVARTTGRRIEVTKLRTETQQVFANPEGTFTLEQHARPVRVRRGGELVPVDTTLRRLPDGSISPVATAVELAFSGGGDGPLVRLVGQGRDLALGWPGPLPAPTLEGDTATYAGVLPEVDMKVQADVDGFAEVLVVRSREAARNPALASLRFWMRSHGLSVRTGGAGNLDVVDEAGELVFHGPTPVMWDSSGAAGEPGPMSGPPSGARQRAISVTVQDGELTLAPDADMLAAADTRFPVFIDPFVSGSRKAWTSVWKMHPDSSYYNSSDIARVGHEIETGQTNRSFFAMDTSAVRGKHILKATLRTYEVWSWSCSARPVELWLTGGISSATTWNNQPGLSRKLATATVARGHDSGCPAGGVDFDATSGVTQAASSGWTTLTLGLRATDETDTYAWKKFRNNPVLEIEYNTKPAVPTQLSSTPGGACVTGSSRPVIGTATPTLRAKVTDADAQNVGARFEWWHTGGSKIGEKATPKVASGTVHSVTVPTGAFANGGIYSWRVRAEDGIDVSAWSAWCELKVDLTPPGSGPLVSSSTYPETKPTDAEPTFGGGVGLAGAFTFAPGTGDTDVVAFMYGLDDKSALTRVAASGTGSTATATIRPETDWVHTLWVRSVDAAGNMGPFTEYQFYVRAQNFPLGYWKLDEGTGTTAADASGNGHTATLSGGASWTEGRNGKGLALDGSSGRASTATPVLRTDGSFSVTAWVRFTGGIAWATAVSQDGNVNSGFYLGYSGQYDRWVFSMASADTTSEVQDHALSVAPPQLNAWTHLAGIYNSSTQEIRLYVNGVFQSSVIHLARWQAAGGLQIGRAKWRNFLTNYWPGAIDDVRAHVGVLPELQIADQATRPPALVGQWRLDETSGTSAADSSGHGQAATLTGGATWTSGHLGGALSLDGSTGSAGTAGPVVQTDQSFSISAWVRFTGSFMWCTAVSQDGNVNSGFYLEYSGMDDRWTFSMPNVDSSEEVQDQAISPDPPQLNVWTHLAGVYDAPAREMRLYVNGVLVATAFHESAWHAAGPLLIGRGKWRNFLLNYWPGDIDDVRVFAGVLTDAEVSQLAAG